MNMVEMQKLLVGSQGDYVKNLETAIKKLNDHQLKAGGFNSFGGLNHRLKEKTSIRRWF